MVKLATTSAPSASESLDSTLPVRCPAVSTCTLSGASTLGWLPRTVSAASAHSCATSTQQEPPASSAAPTAQALPGRAAVVGIVPGTPSGKQVFHTGSVMPVIFSRTEVWLR